MHELEVRGSFLWLRGRALVPCARESLARAEGGREGTGRYGLGEKREQGGENGACVAYDNGTEELSVLPFVAPAAL